MCQRRQNSVMLAERYGWLKFSRKVEAEKPTQPDRHVGIAGEVEVDLQRVAQHAQPCMTAAEFGDRQGKDRVGDGSDAVRDDDLLAEPEAKPVGPVEQGYFVDAAIAKFRSDLPVADDRAGDKLREQRVVDSEFSIACRGRDVPLVNVHQVGNGLEREEGNPYRQRYCGRWGKRCRATMTGELRQRASTESPYL